MFQVLKVLSLINYLLRFGVSAKFCFLWNFCFWPNPVVSELTELGFFDHVKKIHELRKTVWNQWRFRATAQGWLMLLPLLFQMKLNVLCTFFSSVGTLSERWGTTDLPIVLGQIPFHFSFQDSDMTVWKAASLPSHCHWLSAKSASSWGSSRAMVIIGRMLVRALLLRSTACSGRNKFRAVHEEWHSETINVL